MTRASRNLCFLLAVTVVNVIIYIAISGNLFIFKNYTVREQPSNNKARLAGDSYQDRMTKLVREAIRDQRLSEKNLTEMLAKAMTEYGPPDQVVPGTTHIHQGKSFPVNRTVVFNMQDVEDESVDDEDVMGKDFKDDEVNEQKPDKQLLIEIEDIKAQEQPVKKEEGNANAGQDKTSNEGVLDRLGNYLSGKRDSGKPIVFPHDYNLVINEPNKCKHDDGSDKPIFFLVLITSVHKNFDQRNAIRRTWASPRQIDGKEVVTMFLLAKTSNPSHQQLVEQESKQYHDLIMEDFTDTYKNLTLKTIMAMKWASVFCPQAAFVMKTDDDMFVSYANIIKHLSKPVTPTKSYVTGFVINGGPIRDPKSKWYMPRETYPGSKYPPFCSGTGYVMSGDMPARISETSLYTPFIYLEDVYVAICLDALKVVPIKHKEFNNWRTAYSYCRFKRIFTTHMVTPTEMHRIWNDQKTNKGYHCAI